MNEERKEINNSTVKTILIVILTILLIALLSFTLYDKVIKKEDNKTEENNNLNDNQNDTQEKDNENITNIVGLYSSNSSVKNYIALYNDGTFIIHDNESGAGDTGGELYSFKGKYTFENKIVKLSDFEIILGDGFYDNSILLGVRVEQLSEFNMSLSLNDNNLILNNYTFQKISSDPSEIDKNY